jgi:hypothetical protein
MGNKIEEALKRIKELKETTGYKEIEDYLIYKEESNYFLNDVMNEGSFNNGETEFKKYILKGFDSDFIKPNNLNTGKKLYQELKSIINEFIGEDYVLIIFSENGSRSWRNDEMEVFTLMFRKTFATKKLGQIKVLKLEDCNKGISVGEISTRRSDSQITIQLNCLHLDYFRYQGNSLKNENVLFYGFNIEENPYLVKLFETNAPKKLLNIVPVNHRNSFFHDNVD